MVIFKLFFCKTYKLRILLFFATGEKKIIAYEIPTGPSMLVKERFPLSLFLFRFSYWSRFYSLKVDFKVSNK